MSQGSISSPQDPKVKSIPSQGGNGRDLNADQLKVALGGKQGSGAIDSPTSPKLGGKRGQA